MAATPSALAAQATGITTISLQWTISALDGTTYDVKRALSGGVLATIATTAADAYSYNDSGLAISAAYDYQVCRAGSAVCTSVVTVATFSCVDGRQQSADSVALPRAASDTPTATDFNDLADQIETVINQESDPAKALCTECSVHGALVLDCSRCMNFEITMTEDINSITMPNCDDPDGVPGVVDFIVPAGAGKKICGWPSSFGAEGGECRETIPAGLYTYPFRTGASGAVASPGAGSGRPTPNAGAGKGGGAKSGSGGGGAPLSISCGTCILDCASGTAASLTFTASGGTSPYSWSTTKGQIPASGASVALTPAANSGSGTAGKAYALKTVRCTACYGACIGGGTPPNCSNVAGNNELAYGCNDAYQNCSVGCATGLPADCTPSTTTCDDSKGGSACTGGNNCASSPRPSCTDSCTTLGNARHYLTDCRSGAMIAAGCVPCVVSMAGGGIVTLTDSLGANVSKTFTVIHTAGVAIKAAGHCA